jgi:hypothetical protein
MLSLLFLLKILLLLAAVIARRRKKLVGGLRSLRLLSVLGLWSLGLRKVHQAGSPCICFSACLDVTAAMFIGLVLMSKSK